MAALMAVSASPASGATKKAGTITNGNSVTLLNTSGFVKAELICDPGQADLRIQGLGAPADVWFDRTDSRGAFVTHGSVEGGSVGSHFTTSPEKPGHVEWSVSRGTKVVFGEVYVAGTGASDQDCLYTSVILLASRQAPPSRWLGWCCSGVAKPALRFRERHGG